MLYKYNKCKQNLHIATKGMDLLIEDRWRIYVSKLTIIGSDNGLAPGRRQPIIRANAGILLIGPLGANFSENSNEVHTFSFKKTHLKLSSAKCCHFVPVSIFDNKEFIVCMSLIYSRSSPGIWVTLSSFFHIYVFRTSLWTRLIGVNYCETLRMYIYSQGYTHWNGWFIEKIFHSSNGVLL